MDSKQRVGSLVVWLNGCIQVGIGLTGIGMSLLAANNGQPMDARHVLCFVGIALSGSNALQQSGKLKGD